MCASRIKKNICKIQQKAVNGKIILKRGFFLCIYNTFDFKHYVTYFCCQAAHISLTTTFYLRRRQAFAFAKSAKDITLRIFRYKHFFCSSVRKWKRFSLSERARLKSACICTTTNTICCAARRSDTICFSFLWLCFCLLARAHHIDDGGPEA